MSSDTLMAPPRAHDVAAATRPNDGAVPLWSNAVVATSILALGTATGLAAHQHAALAPWLAALVGAATAVALYGVHRAWTAPLPPRAPKARQLKTPAPAGPTLDRASAPRLRDPLIANPDHRASEPAPAAPRPRAAEATAPFKPAMPPPEVPPQASPLTDATFDAQVRQLQSLVRDMARETAGPRAQTPDPDALSRFAKPPTAGDAVPGLRSAPASDQPEVQTGFGAEAATERTPAVTSMAATPSARRVAEAVAAERLDVLLETIQSLQEGRPRHFEISVRFRDADNLDIQPSELADIVRRNGLAARIDALKLPRVARVARRVQQRGGHPSDVLSDVAGPSLADHGFMEAFAALTTEGTPPPLVLSFSQADVRDFARAHWSAIAMLADMGFRFALTDVTDVDMDLDLLRARGFVFVKLDADVFLGGLPHATGVIPAREICRHLELAGLAVIVGAVKSENDLTTLRDNGVGYAQGSFFGGPRKVRADIIAAAA